MVTGLDESIEEITQEELHDDLMALRAQAQVGKRPLPPWVDEEIEPWIAEGEFTTTDVKLQHNMTWSAANARIQKWIKEGKVHYVGQRRIIDTTGHLVKIARAYVEVVHTD